MQQEEQQQRDALSREPLCPQLATPAPASSHRRNNNNITNNNNLLMIKTMALVVVALSSCTHAFAVSSRQSQQHYHGVNNNIWGTTTKSRLAITTTTTGRQRQQQQMLAQLGRFRRGGDAPSSPSAASASASTSSLAGSAFNGDSSAEYNNNNGQSRVVAGQSPLIIKNGVSKTNGANGIHAVTTNNGESNGHNNNGLLTPAAAAAALLQKGGHQEDVAVMTTTTTTTKKNKFAEYVAETKLPTEFGHFRLRGYRIPGDPIGQEPSVIYARDHPPMGASKDDPARSVPVRVHDQCLTSEVFGSQRCDCKEQLQMALQYILKHGGCIVYLQQEGRGIGLANKIAAYSLQDVGFDTVDANRHLGLEDDARDYNVIPSILADMNIESIQLMTNNPRKVEVLEALDVNVERTLPMVVDAVNPYNRKYLETKQTRMRHANLANLLSRKVDEDMSVSHMLSRRGGSQSSSSPPSSSSSSSSSPAFSLADQYINNGTEMSANAVQVSLMVEDVPLLEDDPSTAQQHEEEEAGVTAHDDGYCFGRASVEDAIRAMAKGELVVVVDDMDRENEGDFIMAADQCTPLDMAQIIRYSSGVVCLALEDDRLEALQLPAMVSHNEDPKGTAFTVTVDATKEHGITTGISATDRATTVQLLANPTATAGDFHRPGHILPLRARPGGVLARDGHTEAAVDLSKLAGRQPAGVLCELVSEEHPTEMMRLPEIKRFCRRHGYVLTSIVDICQYRRDTEGREQ